MRIKKIGEKPNRSGLAITLVTIFFMAIGAACLIIGYMDSILYWLRTTGIVILVISAIPLLVFLYNLIQKKIDS